MARRSGKAAARIAATATLPGTKGRGPTPNAPAAPTWTSRRARTTATYAGAVAVRLGRRFAGIDLIPEYVDTSRRRILAEVAKPKESPQ